MNAINRNDQRFLWGSTSKQLYLEFIEKQFKHLTNITKEQRIHVELSSIDLISQKATHRDRVIAFVDENWKYTRYDGDISLSRNINCYTLSYQEGSWIITDIEVFVKWRPA